MLAVLTESQPRHQRDQQTLGVCWREEVFVALCCGVLLSPRYFLTLLVAESLVVRGW